MLTQFPWKIKFPISTIHSQHPVNILLLLLPLVASCLRLSFLRDISFLISQLLSHITNPYHIATAFARRCFYVLALPAIIIATHTKNVRHEVSTEMKAEMARNYYQKAKIC